MSVPTEETNFGFLLTNRLDNDEELLPFFLKKSGNHIHERSENIRAGGKTLPFRVKRRKLRDRGWKGTCKYASVISRENVQSF